MMPDGLRIALERLHKQSRRLVISTYVGQACAVLVGACAVWLAIDSFLTGAAFWSAVQTALAYWNSRTFINNANMRREIRARDAALRELERQQ